MGLIENGEKIVKVDSEMFYLRDQMDGNPSIKSKTRKPILRAQIMSPSWAASSATTEHTSRDGQKVWPHDWSSERWLGASHLEVVKSQV